MGPVPDVLDVSSDEEEEVACLEEKVERTIDLVWLKEFLDMSDEELNKVLKLDQVNKPQQKSKSSFLTPVLDDDDDDCVILDGDPENRVTTVDDSSTGSDELVVVGEKGQIACRDYPHPRHLCAKFPHSATPHEKHCDQCHCYVCDSVAPCPMWGTGRMHTDHCHATDKYETWRTLRKNFKLGNTAPLLASTNYSTQGDFRNVHRNHTLPIDNRLLNHIPQNQASRPITMPMFGSLQNQVSRPISVPECSTATNFTVLSGTNHGRCQESGSTLVRNRHLSHSISQNLLGVRSHGIQRVRAHRSSILVPQYRYSRTMLNGLGIVGVGSTLPVYHSTHGTSGFSNHVNPAQQYDRFHAATGFSHNRTFYGQSNVCAPQNVLYPYPFSQPNNLSSDSRCSTAYETQACYQPNGSQNFYANSVQGYNAPSSNVAGLSRNQVLNEHHQIGSQDENACGNVILSGTTGQYSCPQKHHDASLVESALKEDFSAFDSSIENTNQCISSLQTSGPMNISSVQESGTQFTGSTSPGTVDDIKQRLFDFENSVTAGADDALVSELNSLSPDLGMFDAGTLLFDSENSWNCLFRANSPLAL